MQQESCPDQQRLADYCLGKLPEVELELLERHLDECPSCQETVNQLDSRDDTFVAGLRASPPADPHQDEPALKAALQAAVIPPVPQLPTANSPETSFSPYRDWLGIPSPELPPNHYRLLGLSLFEDDADVVHAAFVRQTVLVRKHRTGQRVADANELLNRLEAARRCLVNAEEKKKYDDELRAKQLPTIPREEPLGSKITRWIDGQAPKTTEDFLRCLTSSKLSVAAGAQQFLQSLPAKDRPADAKACATVLATAGKLTPYQARALYQGKPYGLVVADREILELLGKGGMGNVFKARYRRLDRIEAVKIISPKKLISEEAKQRFEREARAAARLNHPNVVCTFDSGLADGVHYLTMEFVDGCDLAKTVKERGPMTVEHAVSCILQAARGLQAAHDKGIIHRDIKPHNLLLDRAGCVKILDLGLARMNDVEELLHAKEGLTQSGQIMGTVDYMSPEQMLDVRKVSPASDVYSLGCTLHFLLTGKTPFQAETLGAKMMAHHHQAVPSLSATRADVSPALDAVFQHMMRKDARERLATMNEVIAALQALGRPGDPPPAPLPPPIVNAETDDSKLDAFLSQIAVSQDLPPGRPAPSLLDARTLAGGQLLNVRRNQRRNWLGINIALGLLLAFLAVWAAITISIRTPEGVIDVELADGISPDDVQVAVLRGGKEVVIDLKGSGEVKLVEGEWQVKLQRGDTKFEVDHESVTVSQRSRQIVKVTQKANLTPQPPVIGKPDKDGWIDLLAAIEPEKHSVKGRWKRDGKDVFTVQVGPRQRAYSPIEVKGSYDVECEFTLNEKTQSGLILPVGNSAVFLNTGFTEGSVSQLEFGSNAEAIQVRTKPLQTNRKMKMTGFIRVDDAERNADIRLEVTDHPPLAYQGKLSSIKFPQNSAWTLPATRRLALVSHETLVTFHSLRIKPQPDLPPQDDNVYAITGDTLPPGKWYDALATVDLEKHALGGVWKRTSEGVANATTQPTKLVVPIQLQGNYELKFAFTRRAYNDWIAFHLPIGGLNQCDLAFSAWNGKVHGISAVSDKWGFEEPQGAPSVVRPGTLVNNQRYTGTARVIHTGQDVEITVTMDDRPFFQWKGPQSKLRPFTGNEFPRVDILGIGIWDTSRFVVHEFAVKPLGKEATLWNPTKTPRGNIPNLILDDEIVEWNGSKYWVSSQKVPLSTAVQLAKAHSGRLLELSSQREMEFINRQFPHRNFWLNAWKSFHSADPRKGWKNDRLEPLADVPLWDRGQPEGEGNELYLALVHDRGAVHDVPADWPDSYVCLEWGEEKAAPDNAPIVVAPRKAPSEFRLLTNGLGGVQQVDPVVWNKDWVEAGEFAHIKGAGQLVFPEVKANSFALELDFTCRDSKGEIILVLGDRRDAHVYMPLQVGLNQKQPTEVTYNLWSWINEGRWTSGHVSSTKNTRNNATIVLRESELAILRNGQKVHGGTTELVDPTFWLRTNSGSPDIVIHRCQLRPLTDRDCAVAGFKPLPKPATYNAAQSKARWAGLLEGLENEANGSKNFAVGTTNTPMNWVEPGEFKMGKHVKEQPRLHTVKLSKGFWMSRTEVTQREWNTLLKSNPSRMIGSDYLPVDSVSYAEACEYCRLLTAAEQKLGRLPPAGEYRLPTEAEWEYACRAGRAGEFPTSDEQNWSTTYGSWVPQEVAILKPNAWGLFDMPGNVTEWCLDAWHDYPSTADAVRTDPFTPATSGGQRFVVRGGTGWRGPTNIAAERTAHYNVSGGYRGFRIVLGPKLTDTIPPQVFDPFAKVEQHKPAVPPAALSVPPVGQKLEVGKWYDLLATIDVEKHAINGLAQRQNDGIYLHYAAASRVVAPVLIQGNYELLCRFRRLGRPEQIAFVLPVGKDATTDISLGAWDNTISSITQLKGKLTADRPTDSSSGLRHGLDADRLYEALISVEAKDGTSTISVKLDDKTLFTWTGPKDDLWCRENFTVPRQAFLALGAETATAFSELRVRMKEGAGERLSANIPISALEPPANIKSQCVKWNDRHYWLSPAPGDFGNAMKLAAKHNARLLTISSDEESAFIRRTWPNKDIWLGAWRNMNDPNPKTGWMDENLQPVKYFGKWGANQPEGHQSNLSINGIERLWNDSDPGWGFHAVLEWGEETAPPSLGAADSGATNSAPSVPHKFDVLASIETAKDTVLGKWQKTAGRLSCTPAGFARIGSAYRPTGDYTSTATLRWTGAVGEANLFLPIGKERLMVRLSEQQISFPEIANSPNVKLSAADKFLPNTNYVVKCLVSGTGSSGKIQVLVNDKPQLNWEGSAAAVESHSAWAIPNRSLGVGSYNTQLQVLDWKLEADPQSLISIRYRRGEKLPANEWVKLWEAPDGPYSGILFGNWRLRANDLTSTDAFARAAFPVELDADFEFRCKVLAPPGRWQEINFFLPFGPEGRGFACFQPGKPGKVVLQSISGSQGNFTTTLPESSEILWRVRHRQQNAPGFVTVEGEVDGKQVYKWVGKQADIFMRHDWPIAPLQLGLGIHRSQVVFQNPELRILAGDGWRLELTKAASAAPPDSTGASSSARPAVKPMPKPLALNLPAAVALPEWVEGKPAPAVALGQVSLPVGAICVAELLGGEGAAANATFAIQPADAGKSANAWEIVAKPQGSTAPQPVAGLQIKDEQLLFQWQTEAGSQSNALQLANCALRLSAGASRHTLAFRAPVVIEPLVIEIEKASTRRIQLAALPPSAELLVELTYDRTNAPPHSQFKPAAKVEFEEANLISWFGTKPEQQNLGTKWEFARLASGIEVKWSQQWQVTGMEKPQRLIVKQMTMQKNRLEQLLQITNAQLQAVSAPNPNLTDVQRMRAQDLAKAEIAKVSAALAEVQNCEAVIKSLRDNPPHVHVRLFRVCGDTTLVLAETKDFPRSGPTVRK